MSTNCLDGFPQYSPLLNTALPTSSSTAHLPALMLATILDNAAPTIITNLAGDVLYANHSTLALLEHNDSSITPQRFSLPPPALSSKSTSSLPYHHSQLLEPVDALNAESIRNHLTGLTTLGLFFQKQTTVSRNVECLTAQTRRSIYLRLSTRILPTTAFDPSQSSPRKTASQVPSSSISTSYSATAADAHARSQGPAPKHTHSTPPNKHQNPTNFPTPFLLLTTLTDLTDPSLIFARDDHRIVLVYNSKGVIVEASPTCLSILGYTLDELLGTWGYDHIHPDDVDQMRDSHARLLAPLAQDERQVFRMRRKNGKYAWLDLRSAGTQTEGAYVFVGFDVTAEKEKEIEAQKVAREEEEDEMAGKRTEEHNKANKFVGFICHELRNPLNGIIGFNSLLLDTPQLSETQLEYAEAIAKISQHMCNLLNQTLDLCQTQQPYSPADSIGNSSDFSRKSPRPDSPHHSTTPRLNYRSLNLKEVVEFGFVTVSVAARAKQTELRFRDDITPMLIGLAHPEAGVIATSTSHAVDPTTLKVVTTGLRPCPVYGDEDSVRKIILNYLTNAIKYTPAAGNVTVHLSVESPTLPPALADTHRGFTARCAITDTGLGIPSKDICRLFLPYSKLINACGNNEEITPQAAAAAGGSSGLGLSICKELADKIGGRVGVDSTMGKGSTFWVTFPVYYDLPEGCVPDEDELRKVCKCVNACVAGTCKLWSSPAIKPTKQRKRPAKVLMVEDNSVNQRVAQKYLEKMGEEVTVASDGADALERMRKEKFDILFVDLQMPVMDGYTFTRHVRAAEHENTIAKVQAMLEPHRRSSSSVLFGLSGTQLDSANSSLSASSSASSSDSLFSPTHEQAVFIARRYSDFSLSPASTPASEPTTPSTVTSHNHIGLILGERPVPIVACTGNVLERDRALCKELGMDGFLSKPYKMDDMRRCIDELVIYDDEDMERGE